MGFVGLYGAQQAQVICNVEIPASVSGNYTFTYTDPGGGWGSPDLLDPLNAVTDTLVLADDGTADDSLACNALINGAAMAGNIAFLYRGACQFGTKALNAENAGAIAVVIVNNVPGAPVGMGAGTDGPSVTIPVIMISDTDGALLRAEMEAGNDVRMFIGNKAGFYNDDLGVWPIDVVMADRSAQPSLIASNASEFDVTPGAWVHNFGNNNQSTVTLQCDITYGGATVYTDISAPVAINSGDSAFISLTTFSQPAYLEGYYGMTYTVDDVLITDEFPADNTIDADFMIDASLFSYAQMDSATSMPIRTNGFRPGGSTVGYTACVHFQDPNASRMGVSGLWMSGSGGLGGVMTGELLEAYIYEWNDSFTGLSDAGIGVTALNQVGFGDYTYTADLQGDLVYVPLISPVSLVDNQRYLFCQTSYSPDVFFGYNDHADYTETINIDDQPRTVVEDNGTWFVAGFGFDVTLIVTANMFDITTINVNEHLSNVDVNAFPNPTANYINLDFEDLTGNTTLEMMDVTGRVVKTENFNLAGELITIDVQELSAGTYTCRAILENGQLATFSIVIQ